MFIGGTVVTAAGERPEEALAMRDGQIVAVGDREEVLAGRPPGAVVVDLAGGALLPGFVEAHGHPLQVAEALAPPALDVLSLADDFEFDEVGSDVDVSPENSTECDQQVNQAASASG